MPLQTSTIEGYSSDHELLRWVNEKVSGVAGQNRTSKLTRTSCRSVSDRPEFDYQTKQIKCVACGVTSRGGIRGRSLTLAAAGPVADAPGSDQQPLFILLALVNLANRFNTRQ